MMKPSRTHKKPETGGQTRNEEEMVAELRGMLGIAVENRRRFSESAPEESSGGAGLSEGCGDDQLYAHGFGRGEGETIDATCEVLLLEQMTAMKQESGYLLRGVASLMYYLCKHASCPRQLIVRL